MISPSLNRLARSVWNHLPESVRGWLRSVRAGDWRTRGAVLANRVLHRVFPQRLRRKLTGGPPVDRPTWVERLIASPYVSYSLLKRADTQRVLRQTSYQRFLDSYTTHAHLSAQNALGTPDAGSFVQAALLDPALRNAFGYQDLSAIVTLSDERAALQLTSQPQYLTKLLDDPVVLAAFRRRALEEGPDAYATRIAQEIHGRTEYRRSIFQRLGLEEDPDTYATRIGEETYGRAEYRRSIFDRLGIGGGLTLARCGKSTVIASLSDYGIAKELFATQAFELGAFQRYLSSRDNRAFKYFIDVGANLGTHTLYALREAGFERALAIEPDPRNLPLLRANLALNGVDGRGTVLPFAVAASQGWIELFQSEINWGDNRTSPTEGEGWARTRVPTTSLDQVLKDSGFDPVGLTIWIDVQGAEYSVLQGASETLASDADVVIEFWPHELSRIGQLNNMVHALTGLNRKLVRLDDGTPIDPASITDLAQDLLQHGPTGYLDIALLPRSSA